MSSATTIHRGFFHIIKANENDVPLVFGTDYESVTKNYRSVIDDQRITIDHLEDQAVAAKNDMLDVKEQYLEEAELVKRLVGEEKELLEIVRNLEEGVEEKDAQLRVFEEEQRELLDRVETLDEENTYLIEQSDEYIKVIEALKKEIEEAKLPLFKFPPPTFEHLTRPSPIPHQDSYGSVIAELMSYPSPKDVLRTSPKLIPVPPPPPPLPPSLINFRPIVSVPLPVRHFNYATSSSSSSDEDDEKDRAMNELDRMLKELDSKIEGNRIL